MPREEPQRCTGKKVSCEKLSLQEKVLHVPHVAFFCHS